MCKIQFVRYENVSTCTMNNNLYIKIGIKETVQETL